jgi:hypothetical protein
MLCKQEGLRQPSAIGRVFRLRPSAFQPGVLCVKADRAANHPTIPSKPKRLVERGSFDPSPSEPPPREFCACAARRVAARGIPGNFEPRRKAKSDV